MNYTKYAENLRYTTLLSTSLLLVCLMVYIAAEPTAIRSQAVDTTPEFRIRQTITNETSFLVDPANVTMSGNIAGLTGGTATGTANFVVRSNNPTGYYVEIDFTDDDADGVIMRGDGFSGNSIRNYSGDVAGEPSVNLTASTAAQFVYNVASNIPGHVDQSFKLSGTCNQPAGSAADFNCWKAPSTTPFRIISNSGDAPTGATSTIKFVVQVPSNPIPSVAADTYTATATLSLFIQ